MAGVSIVEKYSERATFVQRDAGNVPSHTRKTGGRRQRREGAKKGDKENEQKNTDNRHALTKTMQEVAPVEQPMLTNEEKMQQFQQIMNRILSNAIQENNRKHSDIHLF